MKKLVLFLVVADLMVFAFGTTYVQRKNSPLEYTFLVYDKAGYKREIYKPVKVLINIKLAEINNNTPSIVWEKKLVENISLYDLPGKDNPLVRKFNIGYTKPTDYLIYSIFIGSDTLLPLTQNAVHIYRDHPTLSIGL